MQLKTEIVANRTDDHAAAVDVSRSCSLISTGWPHVGTGTGNDSVRVQFTTREYSQNYVLEGTGARGGRSVVQKSIHYMFDRGAVVACRYFR